MKNLIALLTTIIFIALVATLTLATNSSFYKAFTKTVIVNTTYEQNITIRKFYNLTVRFRYSYDGNDLTFNDTDVIITLKDQNKNEISIINQVTNGKAYLVLDRKIIDSIAFVDVINLDKYEDVRDQIVNITYYGTKAYLTVIVQKKEGNATISGYVFDALTSEPLDDIEIYVYAKGADPYTSNPLAQSVTENGRYFLTLFANSDGITYDIYVKDYPIN